MEVEPLLRRVHMNCLLKYCIGYVRSNIIMRGEQF